MAGELGSIQYTDVNAGTRVVDRSGEARAIAQGLDITKKTIDEGVKASVTGDMLEAIDNVEAPQGAIDARLEIDEEAVLLNKIDALNLKIKNGTVSQVTLAQNQVKQILADAQERTPWLRDELQRRANSVLAGSTRLAQLGLEDQIRTAEAKTAQEEFTKLTEEAYELWENGGLGIPRDYSPTSPEFASLYKDRRSAREMQQISRVTASMALARAELQSHDPTVVADLRKTLQGHDSLVRGGMTNFLQEFDYDGLLAQLNLGDKGDLEYIELWKTQNGQQAINSLVDMQSDMSIAISDARTRNPQMFDTDAGKELLANMEDLQGEYGRWITAIQGVMEGVPGAADVIARGHIVRTNDAFNRLTEPGKEMVSFFTSPTGETILELMTTLKNPVGINLANRVALSHQAALSDVFKDLFDPTDPNFAAINQAALFKTSGALQIPPGTPASTIQQTIRNHLVDPHNSFIKPASNNEEALVLALHNKDIHEKMLTLAKNTLKDADPDFANNALLGMTYSLAYLNTAPNPPNVQEDILDSLASNALDYAINISLTGASPGERQAFAMEAQDLYMSTKPHTKRQEVANHYKEHRIGNKALSELVKIDVDAIDDGNFAWRVEDSVLDEAAKYVASRSVGMITTEADIARARQTVIQEINEEMSIIKNTVDRQIAIEMTLNKARAANEHSLQQANDWGSFFLGAGDPSGAITAWANYFNYTKTGTASRSR